MNHKILSILFLFMACFEINAQQQFVGVNINLEKEGNANLKPGFGLIYEYQLANHHGFEIDLNYRSKNEKMWLPISISNNDEQLFEIRESYLTMPVLYKFYSNVINVSTGITFDYFIGWNNLTNVENVQLTSYKINPKLYVGWAFRISKSIPLSPKFILEPEIQLNPIFKYDYCYYGVGVKLKYKL